MQILTPNVGTPVLNRASQGTVAEATTPPGETSAPPRDGVTLSYDKEAIKAEESKLAKEAKVGALLGGGIGALAGTVAGAVGGVLGALIGLTVAPAGALIGAVAGGAGGFMLATHNREGSLALLGGILAGAAGAVIGGFGGFYGGAALGAVAGAAGGIAGGLAGAIGLGTIGAGVGAVARVSNELIGNGEAYPNVLARFKQDQAKEAAKEAPSFNIS